MPPTFSSAVPTVNMMRHSWLFTVQASAFDTCGFLAAQQSVSSYISPWFSAQSLSPASFQSPVYVQDPQITACLLNQALEYAQRSVCNLIAAFYLANNGLDTWAKITNYYASYFGVHALLCLQGKTITRLSLQNETFVQVYATDFNTHNFCFTSKEMGKNPHHQTPWRRFYEVYDSYSLSESAYELIARKAYVTDPTDESIERNSLNYTPFLGFEEIRNLSFQQSRKNDYQQYTAQLSTQSTLDDLLQDLRGLSTDPDHKYYARAVLKIAFLAQLFYQLGANNYNLSLEWNRCKQTWIQLLVSLSLSSENCYLAGVISLIK